MRILFFLLFPVFLSAQINRAYGVIEIGATFPTSSTTGPKFAYRTVDSSFYRWVSGNTWVKIIEPSIIPDTLYLTELIGTSYKVSGDTINLTPYLLKSDTTAMLVKYIERGDTLGMLSAYIRSAGWGLLKTSHTLTADSSKIASRFYTSSNFFPLQGGTLTGTGGAGFIGFPSQVSAPGTPASGLNVYAQGSSFNWKGTDGYERQFASTLTGGRTYTLPNVSGTFALGTGTATRIPIWTSTNAIGDSPIVYNSTTKRTTWDSPGVIEFPMGTTAQRPSPANKSDFWFNDSNGFFEGYFGSQWENFITSTGASNGQVSIFSSAGKTYGTNNLFWDNTNSRLGIGNPTPLGRLDIIETSDLPTRGITLTQRYNGPNGALFSFKKDLGTATTAVTNGTVIGTFYYAGNDGTTYRNSAFFGGVVDGVVSSNNVPTAIRFGTGTTDFGTERMRITSSGNMLIGTTTDVSRRLHVSGEVRITDLTTDTPTRIVGADADGDLNAITVSSPLTLSGGVLSGSNIYTSDGTLSGNRTITGGNLNVTWDNITAFQIQSGGVTPGATVLSDVYYSQRQNYNQAKSRYFTKYQTVDTRAITGTNRPNFVDIYEWDFGGGTLYEWDRYVSLDTTNNVFFSKSGSQDYPHFNRFVSRRPASGTTYRTTPRFAWVGTSFTENANANTIHTIWGRTDALIYMTLKDEGRFMLAPDSTFIFDPFDDVLKISQYGSGNKEAADLSKTQSNYIAGFATDGTVLDLERKRDTTVYVVDTDLDWSAAITTAQIASRYNRVIFLMTTTAAAGSNSDLTLHTPDINLMQVEYLIRSTDEAGGFTNVLKFGTNNAVQSDNGLTDTYTPAPGQGVGIRAGLRSGVYKYFYY